MPFRGQSYRFCYCSTLNSRVNLTVFYSQVEDGYMEIGMTMTDPSEEYMSIGFPERRNTMVGADAMVARKSSGNNGNDGFLAPPPISKPSRPAASIGQFALNAYAASGVVPTNALAVSEAQVEQSGNTLSGESKRSDVTTPQYYYY